MSDDELLEFGVFRSRHQIKRGCEVSREFNCSLAFGYRVTELQVRNAFKANGNGARERYEFDGVDCEDDFQMALNQFCEKNGASWSHVGDFYSSDEIEYIIEPNGVPGSGATIDQLMRLEEAASNLMHRLRDCGIEVDTGPLVQVSWTIG